MMELEHARNEPHVGKPFVLGPPFEGILEWDAEPLSFRDATHRLGHRRLPLVRRKLMDCERESPDLSAEAVAATASASCSSTSSARLALRRAAMPAGPAIPAAAPHRASGGPPRTRPRTRPPPPNPICRRRDAEGAPALSRWRIEPPTCDAP